MAVCRRGLPELRRRQLRAGAAAGRIGHRAAPGCRAPAPAADLFAAEAGQDPGSRQGGGRRDRQRPGHARPAPGACESAPGCGQPCSARCRCVGRVSPPAKQRLPARLSHRHARVRRLQPCGLCRRRTRRRARVSHRSQTGRLGHAVAGRAGSAGQVCRRRSGGRQGPGAGRAEQERSGRAAADAQAPHGRQARRGRLSGADRKPSGRCGAPGAAGRRAGAGQRQPPSAAHHGPHAGQPA